MKKAETAEQEAAEVKTKLTAEQTKQLVKLEETIQEHSQKGFIEVGDALSEICESGLYKDVNKSFDRYCESRWGFSGSHARRLIDAASFVKKLRVEKVEDEYLPSTESLVRWFFELRVKQYRVRAWVKLVKAAKSDKKQLTTEFIREQLEITAAPKVQKAKQVTNSSEDDKTAQALTLIEKKRKTFKKVIPPDWKEFLDNLESLLTAP